MDLIIACFTEAHHNPYAAFLAAGITITVGAYIFIIGRWVYKTIMRQSY